MTKDKPVVPPPRRLVTVTVASYADYEDQDHHRSMLEVEPEPGIPDLIAYPAAIGSLKMALNAAIEQYVESFAGSLKVELDDEDTATMTEALRMHYDEGGDERAVEAAIATLSEKHADDPKWAGTAWVPETKDESPAPSAPAEKQVGFYL